MRFWDQCANKCHYEISKGEILILQRSGLCNRVYFTKGVIRTKHHIWNLIIGIRYLAEKNGFVSFWLRLYYYLSIVMRCVNKINLLNEAITSVTAHVFIVEQSTLTCIPNSTKVAALRSVKPLVGSWTRWDFLSDRLAVENASQILAFFLEQSLSELV